MSVKHTPGPWEYKVVKNKIRVIIKQNTVLTLGTIYYDDCNEPSCCKSEEHANAKLIAAAPELLEALQELIYQLGGEQEAEEEIEKSFWATTAMRIKIAKAAIKKATE
jgi:hypothetical protein